MSELSGLYTKGRSGQSWAGSSTRKDGRISQLTMQAMDAYALENVDTVSLALIVEQSKRSTSSLNPNDSLAKLQGCSSGTKKQQKLANKRCLKEEKTTQQRKKNNRCAAFSGMQDIFMLSVPPCQFDLSLRSYQPFGLDVRPAKRPSERYTARRQAQRLTWSNKSKRNDILLRFLTESKENQSCSQCADTLTPLDIITQCFPHLASIGQLT